MWWSAYSTLHLPSHKQPCYICFEQAEQSIVLFSILNTDLANTMLDPFAQIWQFIARVTQTNAGQQIKVDHT